MFFDWLEDAARHHGTANAVVQKDTYLSFRGLVHRAQRRMQELRALGLEPGTAMGILLGNVSDFIVLALAANKLGAAVVPMAPQCSARELAHAMAVLPLRAIVSRPGLRALEPDGQLLAHEPRLPSPTKRTRLQGSLLSCALYPAEGGPTLPPDTAIVHLVPGSAGPYNPVIRSATALSREAERLHALLGSMDRLKLGAALPLYQPFTLEIALALTCGYGAALHLDDDLAPRQTAHRARETSQVIWAVTRALLWSLVTITPHRPLGPGSRLLCVDGPVGRALGQASHRALGIHPEGLLHCPEVGLVSMDSHGRAPSTVGAVVPGLEIRLVGPRQAPVAAGRQGRLLASPVEFEGTGARKQGAGKRAGSPEDRAWIDTGHLAAQDPLGRLKLHGRDDDRVLVGGLPVSLSEVREILLAHPSVSDAEVTEPPPEAPSSLDGAALLLARAARRDGIPEEALLAHMGRLLSPHKIPARVDLVGARGPTARAETGRRRPRS